MVFYKYGGHFGYVSAPYIAIESDGGECRVSTASGALNIRKNPSSSASVIYKADQNATLRLLDTTSVSGWYRVSSADGTGWGMDDYLTVISQPGTGGNSRLSRGDTGEAVEALQQKLQAKKYYYGHSFGVFDSRTEWAVKYFQHRNGLTVTGIADAQTMAKLDSDLAVWGVNASVVNATDIVVVDNMKMSNGVWANEPFDANQTSAVETIGTSGNAPTAIAIAFSTLWKNAITPPVIAEFAKQNGLRDETGNNGVTTAFFQRVANEWDVRYANTTTALATIQNYCQAGGVAVVRLTGNSAHNYCTLNGATYVVVYKVDENYVYLTNSNTGSNAPISRAVWEANINSWVKEAHLYGFTIDG